jgi:hypothetical protein
VLCKARHVTDQRGSGAVAVPRGRGEEEEEALVDYVVHRLKGDLFPELMEYMWEGGCPRVEVTPIAQPNPEPEPPELELEHEPEPTPDPTLERGQGVVDWAWGVAGRFAPQMTRWLRGSE